MFRSTSFEKHIENATSHLHLEPDWPTIILICDAIRQNDVTPRNALGLIKKKMFSSNPHTAMYSLIVLESVVKNCGAPIHDEISSKESCEMFTSLISQTAHENVRSKMLELIQCWAYAFRSTPKYRAIKDTMNILKTEGRSFPELKEADAMFTSDTAPDWADGEVCDRCRTAFSFTQRKHHCRNCGQVFCHQCSSKSSTLPKYGIEKEVRVCDGCYDVLQKPSATSKASSGSSSDLPAIYLSSTLAQQSQTPARKSEQELKEEEEFQLALALSQSEAEEAEKKKMSGQRSVSAFTRSYSPPRQAASPVASPVTSAPTVEESDPELARYLNRNYWEQKQLESPASPSAPIIINAVAQSLAATKISDEEAEIEEFSQTMRSQVEIFVNRMKSNSSRGRNISNDSSVQTLFMNLTSHHSKLLTYIKAMDDKRMWYEQLQDKLAQVKDSRAALDVLRQEHREKLRRQAEEMEHQRQVQMAQKLEIMRKKKQEFLQYQRQMAVHRIQEQEREMAMRQEQQKTQYMMQFSGQAMQNYSPQHHQQAMGHPGMQAMGGGYPGGVGPHYGGPPMGGMPMGGGYAGQPPQLGGGVNQGMNSGGHGMPMGQPMPGQFNAAPVPGGMVQGNPGGMAPGGTIPNHPQNVNNNNSNMMPGMHPNLQQSQQSVNQIQHNMQQQQNIQMGMNQQQQHLPMQQTDQQMGREVPMTQPQHHPGGMPGHPQQQIPTNVPQQQQPIQQQPPVTVEAPVSVPAPVTAAAPAVEQPPAKKEDDPPMAELISFD